MKGRFVTIFPHLQAQHLVKDVAQIPYRMQCSRGYEAELVTVDNREELSRTRASIGDLQVKELPAQGRIGSLEKAILRYIQEEAKAIDVLHLENFIRSNFFYGLLYKWKNPRGLLYLKGDIYNHRLEERTVARTRKSWKKPLIRMLERKFMKELDLISLENQKAIEVWKKVYPKQASKAIHLPNGIDEELLERDFPEPTPWAEKEDRFLVVGRIGKPFKNHEILLDALGRVDLKGWTVRFIGAVEEAFHTKIEAFFEKYPEKRSVISFQGPIHDRQKLLEEQRIAKVQLLPSKLESFGHVLLEGGVFDQYIIGSQGILPFEEVTKNGRFGEALEEVTPDILADRIQQIVDEPEAYRIPTGAFRAHILEQFTWGKVVKELDEALQERAHQR